MNSPSVTARILHGVLIGSVFVALLLGSILRVSVPAPTVPEKAQDPVKVAYLALVAGAVFHAGRVRRSVPPAAPDENEDAYWRLTLVKALPAWALADGAAFVAAVLGWAMGSDAMAPAMAIVSLAVLFYTRPAALSGRT